ncbi:anthranilate phosphoribosyltransferase [bacterium]|nr:anthranilate phosphoribosyltransferase [bacterium]
MIKEAIGRVVSCEDLKENEMVRVMDEIMSGQATPAQIGAFITGLRIKGETVEEITGAAKVMREKATCIRTKSSKVVDTCGTGGDEASTFNISTAAAFVAAGAGLTVAKHGNRSVSSKCGSADVLLELGVNLDVDVAMVEECLDEIGIGFLFAPLLHGAMKYAIGPRREIGIRTIFNILGPLTNPASARYQVMGVYDGSLTEPLANVLKNLGSEHVFVVHGEDGLDEATLTTGTRVSELKDGKVRTYYIKPSDFGFEPCQASDLTGGEPGENARILLDVLGGEKGPRRDIVLLNAALAIVAAKEAENLEEGIKIAANSIDSGKALEKLELLKQKTNR